MGAPVLMGFNAGSYARQLQTVGDRGVVHSAMQVLRTCFGAATPDPIAAHISHWASDPFARGSYSYFAPGSTPDDLDALAEPVADVLHFAGEHTHRTFPSTVHGALLSGQRAARAILAM
jgi:monoamine oxidase